MGVQPFRQGLARLGAAPCRDRSANAPLGYRATRSRSVVILVGEVGGERTREERASG